MPDENYKDKISVLNKTIEKQQKMLKQMAEISTPIINLNVSNPASRQLKDLQEQLKRSYEPIRQYQKMVSNSYPDFSNLTGMATLASELAKVQLNLAQTELTGIQECMARIANITKSITTIEFGKIDSSVFDTYSKLLDISNKVYKSYSSKLDNDINADYLIDSLNKIDSNKTNEEFDTDSVINYISKNKEEINAVFDLYKNETIKEDTASKIKKKEIDWKFIIGNILMSLLQIFVTIYLAYNVDKEPADKEPTVEINNYYGETTKTEVNNSQELSHEDIQKMIKLLEEIDKQNEESNRMKDQSNP